MEAGARAAVLLQRRFPEGEDHAVVTGQWPRFQESHHEELKGNRDRVREKINVQREDEKATTYVANNWGRRVKGTRELPVYSNCYRFYNFSK